MGSICTLYQWRKFGHTDRYQFHSTEKRQCVEAARGWPSISQGGRSLRKQTLPALH